jgi:hypothetical protein
MHAPSARCCTVLLTLIALGVGQACAELLDADFDVSDGSGQRTGGSAGNQADDAGVGGVALGTK